MQAHVPYWMVVLIGAMYRFVVGGFGVSLPHPYKAKICPRFWLLALPGCTVGLPIVLIGWAIRLTLGEGRAERFFDWVGDVLYTPQAKVLGKVFLGIMITAAVGALLFAIGYLLYKYGWWQVAWVAMVVAGGIAVLIGVLVCIAFVGDKLRSWNASRPKREKHVEEDAKEKGQNQLVAVSKKSWVALKTILKVVTWPLKMILLGIWQILEFAGGALYAGYKNVCTVQELP
jgi:hypothetical protein